MNFETENFPARPVGLLIVDAQDFYINRLRFARRQEFSAKVDLFAEKVRTLGVRVIWIVHNVGRRIVGGMPHGDNYVEGSEYFPRSLTRHPSPSAEAFNLFGLNTAFDDIYMKSHFNGFYEPAQNSSDKLLDAFLKKYQTRHVLIVGMNAAECVRETAIGSVDKGYRCTVITSLLADYRREETGKEGPEFFESLVKTGLGREYTAQIHFTDDEKALRCLSRKYTIVENNGPTPVSHLPRRKPLFGPTYGSA